MNTRLKTCTDVQLHYSVQNTSLKVTLCQTVEREFTAINAIYKRYYDLSKNIFIEERNNSNGFRLNMKDVFMIITRYLSIPLKNYSRLK